jgi:hypothetical protein
MTMLCWQDSFNLNLRRRHRDFAFAASFGFKLFVLPYQKTTAMANSLQHFLNAHKCPAGATPTHCGAGTWLILPDEEPELLKLVASARDVPYIVEDTLPSGCAPLVLDLDFNAPEAPPEGKRLWEVSGLDMGNLAQRCWAAYAELTEGVSPFVMF